MATTRSTMMTVLFCVIAFVGAYIVQATTFQSLRSFPQGQGTADYVISMQRCKGRSDWTLHGLWPEWAQECKGPAFSMSALNPIMDDMVAHWSSCPEFGKSNLDFWTHEWSKHGTCYAQRWNATQIQYFDRSLELLQQLSPKCSPSLTGECRIKLDKNLKPLN